MEELSIKDLIINTVDTRKQNESLVSNFEGLAKEVTEDYDKTGKKTRKPDSFRVTDLVNPMQAYMDIKNPDLVNPEELEGLFAYGIFVEQKVISLLKRNEGFASYQGSVNGKVIGMPEVKGLIDARIGDSIVEIKSSEKDLSSVEELFTRNPQDLEQLLLYSLFTNRERYYHYLLYVVGRHPKVTFRLFKVKITKSVKLVEYFKDRLANLKLSLNNEMPNGLGKCRYFEGPCKFRQSNLCGCEKEKEIDVVFIRDSTYIQLIDSQDEFPELFQSYGESLSTRYWDLFQPRKWLLNQTNPFYYENWGDDYYYLRRELEERLVRVADCDVKRRSSSNENINDSFLAYKDDPLLVRLPKTISATGTFNEWYLAQLGLRVITEKKKKGYIFVYYKDNKIGKLFEVTFKDRNDALDAINRAIEQMKRTYFRKSDSSKLPKCPEFVRDKCKGGCLCED